MSTEINWRENCLTKDVHNGRPEALWIMPLLQAIHIFTVDELCEMVIARIYNDAMQFVNADAAPQSWAFDTQQHAKLKVRSTLQHKVGELTNYYKTPQFRKECEDTVQYIKDNKLNPHYQPLHSHDSINMLCRIVGVSSSIAASKGE